MALPASDNFNRADGDLGANWTALKNSAGNAVKMAIVSNQCKPDFSNNYQFNFWNADLFGINHFSQVTVVDTAAYNGLAVGGQADGSGTVNGYVWLSNFGADSRIYRLDSGAFTQLASGLAIPANGSVCKFERTGLRLYDDGVQLGSDVSDATYAGGSPGLFAFSDGVSPRPRVDDWSGDDIAAAPTADEGLGAVNSYAVNAAAVNDEPPGATYAVIGSGGLVFGGATVPIQGRVVAGVGGIVFGGAGGIARGRITTAAGGIVFGGTSVPLRGRAVTGTGGLVFGGAADIRRSAAVSGTGGIVFGGAAGFQKSGSTIAAGGIVFGGAGSIARGRVTPTAGGIVFGGAGLIARGRVQPVSGGIVFGGTGSPVGTGPGSFSITGAGAFVFGGAAALAAGRSVTGAGGVVWGGAATVLRGRTVTGTGGLLFGGAAQVVRGRLVTGTGGFVFGGTGSPVGAAAPTFAITGSGAFVFGGAGLVARGRVTVGSGGIVWGGAATITTFTPSVLAFVDVAFRVEPDTRTFVMLTPWTLTAIADVRTFVADEHPALEVPADRRIFRANARG